MRVLFFTNEFPPHIYGGAGVHVEYLSRELAKLAQVEVRSFHEQSYVDGQLTVRGTKIDGTKFDSSVDRGEPATFPLNQVIPGWTEGVQLMPVGSKFKFFLPSKLAYGEHGAGSIPANAVLVFDVELLAIEKPAADGDNAKK